MDLIQSDNSDESILNCFPNDYSQKSDYKDINNDFQYYDNTYIEKEILFNNNLDHKNLIKVLEFGINRNTCGPYEFGVQFNAKFFMNIIREYYLRLNCSRLNFIVYDRILYIYGHYNQNLKIFTKINTPYINPDLVIIIEGHSKELRANFDVETLLKHLELHNFSNKEFMKMYFVYNQNNVSKKSKKERNASSVNPFAELHMEQSKFNSEFNFEEKAIPGNIIIETQTFKCNVESNFSPVELIAPPHIPSSIFSDYILSISIDKLGSSNQKINPLSPLEIYCNHYICNFISNINSENFLTYENSEGVQFKHENALNFCKSIDSSIDESNFFQKMINFSLKKHELDAIKIINKKTAVIHFYANKKERYYFSKECEEEGNITCAIILCSEESKPSINNIEDCCIYQEHWNEWLTYLSNILPKDCINELDKRRKLKDVMNNNNIDKENSSTNNKRKRKNNEEKIIINNNEENKENEFKGLSIYSNDRKGNIKKIKIEEKSNELISDFGRETKVDTNANNEENSIKFNPFEIK